MKKLHQILMMGFMAFLVSCSSDPGEVYINTDLAPSVTAGDIVRFVFVVQPTGASTSLPLIFPKACSGGGGSCLATGESKCDEFQATNTDFRLQVPFPEYPVDSELILTMCGLDTNWQIVASGESTVTNTAGGTANIMLVGDDFTACDVLPPNCS